MNSSHRLNMLIFLLLIMPLIIVALYKADEQTPTQTSTESMSELRRIDRECRKIPHGYSHIETVYDAPVGQPRKPVRWIITCQILR